MNRLHVLIACAVLVPFHAAAEEELVDEKAAYEESVYESMSGVAIGRIFYAQNERDYLDRQRLLSPKDATVHTDADAPVAATGKSTLAAGYIISNDGGRKVWKDGDFVSAAYRLPKSISFPGDVKIIRQVSPAAANSASDELAGINSGVQLSDNQDEQRPAE